MTENGQEATSTPTTGPNTPAPATPVTPAGGLSGGAAGDNSQPSTPAGPGTPAPDASALTTSTTTTSASTPTSAPTTPAPAPAPKPAGKAASGELKVSTIKALEDVEEKIAHSLDVAANAVKELAAMCTLEDDPEGKTKEARIESFKAISQDYLNNLRDIQRAIKKQIDNMKDCSLSPYHNSIYGLVKDLEISTMKATLISVHLSSLRGYVDTVIKQS